MDPKQPPPAQPDDTDFMIDLSHAGSVLPPGKAVPAAPPSDKPSGRGPLDMREIQEAIARVEAEAKANVDAPSG